MAKPAHKVDTEHDRPGQIVNPLPEQTTKKLSFEEWFEKHSVGEDEWVEHIKFTGAYDLMQQAWAAAKEN